MIPSRVPYFCKQPTFEIGCHFKNTQAQWLLKKMSCPAITESLAKDTQGKGTCMV